MEDDKIAGSVSRIVSDTYGFKWFISNSRIFKTRETVKSPTFTTGVNNKHKWHLEFNDSHVLHIHLDDYCEDENIYVTVKISSPVEKGEIGLPGARQLQLGKNWSSEKLHEFSALCETFEDYMDWSRLSFDELTIFCEITYEPKELLKFEDGNLLNDLKLVLQNGEHSDVTITVGENKFHVHKFMLELRSPAFAAMFAHDVVENQRKAVKVTDVDHDIMARVLEYIYTDRVDNIEESTERLLIAADKYALEGLKCMCSKVLIERISKENVCDMLKLAVKYSADDLKSGVLDYVSMHTKELIKIIESSTEMNLPLFSFKQILAKF